jgi:DNA polymerase-3 subunit gamma/tau
MVQQAASQAARFGAAELARYAAVVSEALSSLKGTTAPRLQLELMVAQLLLPAIDDDDVGTHARLDALERRVAAAPVHEHPEPALASKPKAEPAPKSESKVKTPVKETPAKKTAKPKADVASPPAPEAKAPPPMDITQIRSLWPAVLDVVKSNGKVAWMVFSDSSPLSWEDGTLAIAMRDASKAANARNSGHSDRLQAAVHDVLRIDAQIDLVLAPDAPDAATPADASAPRVSDEPSIDDANVDDVSGVDLAIRELGATQIGEIEHR